MAGAEGEKARLVKPEDAESVQALDTGNLAEAALLRLGVGIVAARHDPRRRALEDGERGNALGNLGHKLRAARTVANHGDALAREVVIVVPPGRVKDLALELVEAGDVRALRLVELPTAEDHDVVLELLTRSGRQGPGARVIVVGGCLNRRVETRLGIEVLLTHARLEVLEDLLVARIGLGPVVLATEREGVEVRGDIAGGARVRVVEPRAANLGGGLEDLEGRDPCCLQAHSHADATKASANDRDARRVAVVPGSHTRQFTRTRVSGY